jgi:hypothetical protein
MFFKPILGWIPKKIKGEVDIRRRKTPKVSELGVDSTPESATSAGSVSSDQVNIRDNFTKSERDVIDSYLKDRDDVFTGLDYVDEELDKRLNSMSIPYDPNEYPLLYAAHKCPYCGNKSASNVITYDDIKRKRDIENTVNGAVLSMAVPSNFSNMSPEEVASSQEKMFSKLLADMLDMVWRQIIIWILEIFENLTSPLKSVPGASAVPNGISDMINSLRGKSNVSYDVSESDTYPGVSKETVEEYYKSVGPTNTVASLGGVYRTCVNHIRDFNNQVDNLVRGKKEEVYLNLKNVNGTVRENMDRVDQLSASAIPNGYEYDGNTTTGLKYINPVNDSYLQARKDGKGVIPSLLISGENGTHEVFKNVNREWLAHVKNILTGWWESTDTLCCILNNILSVGQMKTDISGGRNLLLAIRSVLAFYRIYLSFKTKSAIANLFNMIIALINGVFTTLLSALATFIQSQINKFLSDVDMTRLLRVNTECVPWNDMVMSFSVYLKKFTEEFGSMLMDFIGNAKMINIEAGKVAKDSELSLKIDNWINLIDSILKFLRVWEFCVKNSEDPYNYMRTDEAKNHFSSIGGTIFPDESIDETIQKLNKITTTYSAGDNVILHAPGKNISDVINEVPSGSEKTNKSWSIDKSGINILLVNYLGLSEDDARSVLNDNGDCACDKVLTDEELTIIRDALEKRSVNV